MKGLFWSWLLASCVLLYRVDNVAADRTVACATEELPCLTGNQCIERGRWCDKNDDCGDISDEAYCKEKSWWNPDPNSCDDSEELLRCDDGTCLPAAAKCDAYKDCKKGEDEAEKICGKSEKDPSEESSKEKEQPPEASSKVELEGDETENEDSKEDDKPDPDDDFDEDKNLIFEEVSPSSPQTSSSSTTTTSSPLLTPTTSAWSLTSETTQSYYEKRMQQATPRPNVQPPRRPDHRAHRGGQVPSSGHPHPSGTPSILSTVDRYPPLAHYNTSPYGPFRKFRNSRNDDLVFVEDRRHRYHYGGRNHRYPGRDSTRYIQDPRYQLPNARNHRYSTENSRRDVVYNRTHKVLNPFHFRTNYAFSHGPENHEAVSKARQWLLGPGRRGDQDWGNNTARALIALSLSGNNSWPDDPESDVLRKNFLIHIGIQILRNERDASLRRISATRLAQYVLALIATCQDPRNIEGRDLTEVLRNRVHAWQHEHSNQRRGPSFSTPLVHLALCVAGRELSNVEVQQMMTVMRRPLDQESSRDSAMLALETFACYMLQQAQQHGVAHARGLSEIAVDATRRLLERMAEDGSFGSVYSTSIAAQALMSLNETLQWNPEETFRFLKNQQHSDGSFGDFLATYHALPALSGKGLLHLRNTQCPQATQRKELTPWEILHHPSPLIYIRYSLHFGYPLTDLHTIQLALPQGISLFDVMRVAEYQNGQFRFSAEVENGKMKVFSIAGTPNDPIMGLAWHLYIKTSSDDTTKINTDERYTEDIRELLPTPDQHIIFWYHSVTRY